MATRSTRPTVTPTARAPHPGSPSRATRSTRPTVTPTARAPHPGIASTSRLGDLGLGAPPMRATLVPRVVGEEHRYLGGTVLRSAPRGFLAGAARVVEQTRGPLTPPPRARVS